MPFFYLFYYHINFPFLILETLSDCLLSEIYPLSTIINLAPHKITGVVYLFEYWTCNGSKMCRNFCLDRTTLATANVTLSFLYMFNLIYFLALGFKVYLLFWLCYKGQARLALLKTNTNIVLYLLKINFFFIFITHKVLIIKVKAI